MASEIMIAVNGVTMPCPYKFEWNLHDVSDSDAGRTQDALMHKNRVAQKRELVLAWHYKTWDEVAPIIQAFNPEYIDVYYPDMLDGAYATRTFYRSDPKVSVKFWWSGSVDRKLLEEISFNLIER